MSHTTSTLQNDRCLSAEDLLIQEIIDLSGEKMVQEARLKWINSQLVRLREQLHELRAKE